VFKGFSVFNAITGRAFLDRRPFGLSLDVASGDAHGATMVEHGETQSFVNVLHEPQVEGRRDIFSFKVVHYLRPFSYTALQTAHEDNATVPFGDPSCASGNIINFSDLFFYFFFKKKLL